MATIVNQTPPTRYERIPAWLRDLVFVTDFFSWLFALCSRLAEPLMLLCTLYIVAEAGVPAIALPALHNLAIGIMICAPEIILPGSFVVAARAQEHARLLFAVCWTFVGLTFVTLISLFVWHFTGASLAWLMCARCAAAVGYSILMRVMAHGQVVHSQDVQQQTREQHIEQAMNQFNIRLQEVQTELLQQVQHIVHSHVTEQVQVVQSTIVEQVQGVQSTTLEQVTAQLATAMQEIKRDMRSALAETTARSSDSSVSSSPRQTRQLRSVPALVHSEPANVRVPRFIAERLHQGHKPSLSEIMDQCQCSKNTAIRYRREIVGTDEEEQSA
jgi:hypothetical protein